MKHLLADCGYIPTPIENLNELSRYKTTELGGVVISTAISSTMKSDYQDVVKAVVERFAGIPVLLATLIDAEVAKKTISLRFKKAGINYQLHSMESVRVKGFVNSRNEMIVIQKEDISEESVYDQTLKIVMNYFQSHKPS